MSELGEAPHRGGRPAAADGGRRRGGPMALLLALAVPSMALAVGAVEELAMAAR
jgi:hypothetical protein